MSDKIIVTVNEGKLRGIKTKSIFSGVEYYSFLGVPYGEAPKGHLRFKDPVKVKPWKNITLDATTERGGCRQFNFFKKQFAGSENCLYNNIHTTQLPSENEPLKPVIVVIHPGGLFHGSPDPDYYGSPDFLMHHDIVFVAICFRIFMLGFLDLGLKDCSGNQGLKDIILSLEWIKENIKFFGGDPNNITILGSSSGSSLVHCLMLSPKTNGLFHKAILMGMYLTNPTLIIPKENSTLAFESAKSLGYKSTDEMNETDKKKLLAYLKKLPVDILLSLRPSVNQNEAPIFPASLFTHMFEQGSNSILPLSLKEMTPSISRVPLLVGFCDKEAAMAFYGRFRHFTEKNFFLSIRQNPWGWGSNLNDEEIGQIQQQIETFYLNGDTIENASLATKCDVCNIKFDILTDIALSDLYDSLINIIAADNLTPVYVYKFQFESKIDSMKRKTSDEVNEPLAGTVHGSDYSYFTFVKAFSSGKNPVLSLLSPRIRNMIEIFTKLICTFARTGNPNNEDLNVQWEPTVVENPCYLDINDQVKLKYGKLNHERTEFLENLKKQYA